MKYQSWNSRVRAFLLTGVWVGYALNAAAEGPQSPNPSAAERLKLARAKLEKGEFEAARSLLEAPMPQLAAWRALLLGQVWLERGDAKAARVLAGVAERPVQAPCGSSAECRHPAWIPAQTLLSRAEDPKAAAARLLSLPADGPRFREAADRLRAAKADKEALAAEKRMLLEVPESFEARTLAAALGIAGIKARLDLEERLVRARAALETHQNEAALREAEALLAEDKAPARCELMYIAGKASRKLRDYRSASKYLNAAIQQCRKDAQADWERRSSLLLVQVESIRRRTRPAQRAVEDLIAHHPEHSYVDDALLAWAQLLERNGQVDRARTLYRQIVDEHAKGDQSIKAAWRLAFEAYRADDRAGAQALLEPIDQASPQELDGARARYWLARIAAEDGKADGKKICPAYRRAALEPSLTYYTWLALDELGRKDKGCADALAAELLELRDAPRPELPRPASIAAHPLKKEAVLLSEAGFLEEAAAVLALLERPGMSREEVIALALAYDEVGAHREAQWLLRTRASSSLAQFPSGSNWHIWRAAYSRPFAMEIESAAKEEGIDPLFLLALVREESTFDPEIVSWAGATGLAQLMPATAIGAYADLGKGRLDLEQLTEPALNVRLGAYVLKSGLRAFAKQEPLALAAYNGGAGLARRTLPSAEAYPFDRWAEEVFVQETRRYVKRVMATYGIYRFLYDADSPFVDLPDTVPARK